MFSLPVRAAALALAVIMPMASPAAAQASFIDHRGRTLTLDAPPARLVAGSSSAAVNDYALDEDAGNIPGMCEQPNCKTFTGAICGRVLPELPGRVVSVAGWGRVPDGEAMVALDPDRIAQRNRAPEINEDDLKPFGSA